MTRAIYLIVVLLFGLSEIMYSNTDTCLAKVNIDLLDDTSSVIDFGYVYVGDTLKSGVVFIRTGPNGIQLPSDEPPYFVKKLTGASSTGNDFAEFDVSQNSFPFRLSTIEQNKSFPIQFVARDSIIYAPGKKECLLTFSVRGETDTSCVAVNRSIIVRATKSFMPLWTDDSIMSFDSVYVNPVSQLIDTIRIHNVYKIDTVKADTTSYNFTKRPQSVFTFSPNQKLSFAPKPGFENPFVIRYLPTQRGVDSVQYKFIHKNPYYSKTTPQIDTMFVNTIGIGVEQKLSIAEVFPIRSKISNDTINIGSVLTQQIDTIKIFMRNDGNIPFNSKGIVLSDNESFRISTSLNSTGKYIQPDKIDTLVIIVNPKNEGLIETICTVKSDIKSRVKGAPKSTEEISFVITGQSIRPRIETLSNTVRFDSVLYFEECLWDTTKSLTIRNVSNFASEITNVVVIPSTSPFYVTKQSFILKPGTSDKIDITFSPRFVSEFNAILQISTRENSFPITVALNGKGVKANPITCKFQEIQTVFPGHKILVPITVNKNLIGLTNTFTSKIIFDSTLLRYNSFVKTSSASALVPNNLITIKETERGTIDINVKSSQYFLPKDTLITLVFDTYLGDFIQSDIAFVKSSFGRSNCESALPVEYSQGIIRLDSLCGLDKKIGKSTTHRYMLFPTMPNPAQSYAQINFNLPLDALCEFYIVNSMGITVRTLKNELSHKGLNTFQIATDDLLEGTYSLVMKSNQYYGVERFVVTK